MNYYEHHIGDYAQATAHLSFVEDAAYSRLIRKYYAEEKPIPADLKAAQRLTGARTREERDAVQAVLEEFFVLKEDGWHSKRCDEEIGAYRLKQGKARASANARWEKRNAAVMRTHTEGNANASGADECERNANASETHNGRNAHQTPDTSHQSPDQEQEHTPAAGETVATAGAVCVRLRSEAGLVNTNPSDPRLTAALAAGVSPDLIVSIAKANPRKPQQYAVAAALSMHNDAASQAAGASHGKPATVQPRESVADRVARANGQPTAAEKRAGSGGQPGGRIIDGQCQSGAA